MKHLNIEQRRPRIAVFDFTGCEGCELQLTNKEETLGAFLSAIEVVSFREASSAAGDDYDVALIDGAITRPDEVQRLKKIRERATLLVAMGSCACFGGVNKLKNAYDLDEANREVYGDLPKETMPTRSVKEVVPVDLELPGCPVTQGGTRTSHPTPGLGFAPSFVRVSGLLGVQAAIHGVPVRRGRALPRADYPGRLQCPLPGRRPGLLGLPGPGRSPQLRRVLCSWPEEGYRPKRSTSG